MKIAVQRGSVSFNFQFVTGLRNLCDRDKSKFRYIFKNSIFYDVFVTEVGTDI